MDLKRNITENGDKYLLAFYNIITMLEPKYEFGTLKVNATYHKHGSVFKDYTIGGKTADGRFLLVAEKKLVEKEGECIVMEYYEFESGKVIERKTIWNGLFNWVGMVNLAECEIKRFKESQK